jgi:hypothetical protein
MKAEKSNRLLGIAILALISCSLGPDIPLSSRGPQIEKRYDYLADAGSGASMEIRNAFMEGIVARGMPREWVLQMYGRPDWISDMAWEYKDRRGNLITGIVFKEDLVDSVYGDPAGGARP